jgi:hypothetical protein
MYFFRLFFLIFFFFCLEANDNNKIIPTSVVNKLQREVVLLKKIVAEINKNYKDSSKFRNDLIEVVMKKNRFSEEISDLIVKQFIQKEVFSKDPYIHKKLIIGHKILSLLHGIKNKADINLIEKLEQVINQFKKLLEEEKFSKR